MFFKQKRFWNVSKVLSVSYMYVAVFQTTKVAMNAVSYFKKRVATLLLRAIKSNLRVVADRNVVSVESISSGVSVNGVASQIW